jgi:myo-inositol-1(or 4)-monophosphatase
VPADYQDILNHALRMAREAGAAIRELRSKGQVSEQLKFGYELVTSADLASNDLIMQAIRTAYPEHRIISEEIPNESYDISGPTWIIDPIDGTVGYANGHYQVSVSIAFADQGAVQVGVVYNPFLEEMFDAVKGHGARLNGESIQVRPAQQLNECVVATGFPHLKENIPAITAYLTRLLPHIRDIRRMGSAALDLCWVACGRLHAYYEGSLSPWDLAAGRLIAIEAGAQAGHYHHAPVSSLPEDICGTHVLVASPGIYAQVRRVLEGE